MDLDRAGRLLDNYAKWVRDSFDVVEEDGCVRIISPMLNRHNDHMSLYLMEAPDGGLLLSDFGETIADLCDGGCDLSTPDRKAKLSRVLAGYGLKAHGDEIFARTDEEGAAKAMSMLMQGMASVDDLFFTVRESAANFFEDEVAAWLTENGVRYMSDIQVVGRSGLPARFEFAIPPSPAAPERLVKTLNAPGQSSVRNALFGWEDIRDGRGRGSELFVFMNGANTSTGDVPQNLLQACRNYGAVPLVMGKVTPGERQLLVA